MRTLNLDDNDALNLSCEDQSRVYSGWGLREMCITAQSNHLLQVKCLWAVVKDHRACIGVNR